MPIYRFTITDEVEYTYEVEFDEDEEATDFINRFGVGHDSAAGFMPHYAVECDDPYRLVRIDVHAPNSARLTAGPVKVSEWSGPEYGAY